MVRLWFTVIILMAPLAALAADGQSDGGYVAPELDRPEPGQLLDQDYLTSTGETVPRPSVPQSSGEMPLDRYIEQENNCIDNSICQHLPRLLSGVVFGGTLIGFVNEDNLAARHIEPDSHAEMEPVTEGGTSGHPRPTSRCGVITAFREARSPLILPRRMACKR
jgi:hypothetical protein